MIDEAPARGQGAARRRAPVGATPSKNGRERAGRRVSPPQGEKAAPGCSDVRRRGVTDGHRGVAIRRDTARQAC